MTDDEIVELLDKCITEAFMLCFERNKNPILEEYIPLAIALFHAKLDNRTAVRYSD